MFHGTIKFSLNNLKFVGKQGNNLRFTLNWMFETDDGQLSLGMSHEGCLCIVDGKRQLDWFPAKSFGKKRIQLHTPSPDLYKLVLTTLEQSGKMDEVFERFAQERALRELTKAEESTEVIEVGGNDTN